MSKYSNKSVNMAEQAPMTVVGVDLGKTWIEVCGQSASGTVRMRGKYRPAKFIL